MPSAPVGAMWVASTKVPAPCLCGGTIPPLMDCAARRMCVLEEGGGGAWTHKQTRFQLSLFIIFFHVERWCVLYHHSRHARRVRGLLVHPLLHLFEVGEKIFFK